MYYLGLDLGKRRDHTAIAVIEKQETRTPWNGTARVVLQIRHVERVPLGTPYHLVVDRVRHLVTTHPLRDNCVLAVDATGLGDPVVEILQRARLGCTITPVTITGQGKTTQINGVYHVPKSDLWTGITLLLEQKQLRISKDMPTAGALSRELSNLRNNTLAARPGEKDDLSMAVALAVWKARQSSFGLTGTRTAVDDYDAVLKFHCRIPT
jgi:hypothetical protein